MKNSGLKIVSISLISFLIGIGVIKLVENTSDNNIYRNNKLIISEEEKEQLYSLLEDKTGYDKINAENDLILAAVIDNPNLTNYEKKQIYKLINIIEDNPDIDKASAYSNFSKLDIIKTKKDENTTDSVAGIYNQNDNTIRIFEEDKDKDILIHELIHCLFTNKNSYKVPNYLKEGVTELLVNEYFSDEPYYETTSYPYEIAMVKLLCDMVDSDVVLKAYTTGDMNLINDKLSLVMDKEETKKYLKLTETMFDEYYEKGNVSLDHMSEFLAYTNEYFRLRGNTSVIDSYEYNKEMLILMKNENPEVAYMFYVIDNGYYVKPYFSKELKKENAKNYQKTLKNNPFDN